MRERNLDTHPYSEEEQRVAAYIVEITGIGGGNDPIGFLILSHQTLRRSLIEMRKERARGNEAL